VLRSSPAWDGPGFVALVEFPQPVVHAVEAQAAVAQAPAHHGAHAVGIAREQPGRARGPQRGTGEKAGGKSDI